MDDKPLLLGIDFGRLESQMLIHYVTARREGTLVYRPVDDLEEYFKDIEHPAPPTSVITGSGFNFAIMDEYFNFMDVEPVEPIIEPPPMKQNGRSAAYLAHDPSKRHRRIRS